MKQETTEQPEEKPIVTRGHYIDFTPRRKKVVRPQARPRPRHPRPYAYTDPQIVRPEPRPQRPQRPEPQPQPEIPQPPVVEEPPKEEIITKVEEIEDFIEDVNYGIIEEYHSVSETTIAKPEPEAPDNNRYSLGGKSPFLESVTVEKRPLSNRVPAKNVYTKPVAEPPKPPLATVVKPEAKKSKVPLVLLIIATVIVGAAVGAGAYFFFFQGQ